MDGKADGWQISSESKFEWEIRDYASGAQLICLTNLESLNSVMIKEGKTQKERIEKLNEIAKSQTTTSSGGLEEPCKGDCVLPFKGGCYKPVTCPPIRNALLAYYWLPYKGHFLVISLFGLFLLLFNISLHCCFIDIAYCFHIIPSCPKFFISSSPEFGMPVKYL